MESNRFPIGDLIAWAEVEGRRPPWREHLNPFSLAIAEVLLQKTKAESIVDIWRECVRVFSTPQMLAEAPDRRIYEIVRGLGLGFQRTGRLKAMAESWPDLRDTGSTLPGLGQYGSGIVRLASGQHLTTAPIDGNIARVMRRYYGFSFERGEARKKPEIKDATWNLLQEVAEPHRQLMLVYGLVDLGAIVCRPSKPNCGECPLLITCSSVLSSNSSDSRSSLIDSARHWAKGGGTASETS